MNILFEARRLGLQAAPEEEIPTWREILRWGRLAPFVFPIGAFIFLLMQGWNAYYAVFWAIIIASVLFLFSDFRLEGLRTRGIKLLHTMQEGGSLVANVAVLLIAANVLVSLMNMSGLGLKLSAMVMGLAAFHEFAAIMAAAVIVIVLGMGLPASASYIIGMSIPGIGLMKLGYPPFAVHMFIFYFACLSNITPPVCPAAFVAAGIAKARWVMSGLIACRLAAPAFLIAIYFLFNPALMMQAEPLAVVYYSALALVGVILVSSGFSGYLTHDLNWPVRILLCVGGFMLLIGDVSVHMVGAVIVASGLIATYALSYNRKRQTRALARPQA